MIENKLPDKYELKEHILGTLILVKIKFKTKFLEIKGRHYLLEER